MSSTERHAHWCGWAADDPRWDDERATIDYGVRPRPAMSRTRETRPAGRARRSLRRGLVAAAALLLFVGLMASGSSRTSGVDRSDAQVPRTPPPGCSMTTPSQLASTPSDRQPPDVLSYEIDLEDCTRTITYDRRAGILTVSDGGSYDVGAPGDWLGVGDWNCDGTPTPALYRPVTGELFVFDGWAGEEALRSEPPTIEVPGGDPEVVDDTDCDRLVVHPPG